MIAIIVRLVALAAAFLAVEGGIASARADEPLSAAWIRAAIDRGLERARVNQVCDARGGLRIDNGRATGSDILNHMAGFAKYAGTTGGVGYPIYVVTSVVDQRMRDETGPPGSLRQALWQARRSGGGWIIFSEDIGSRRIDLEAGLQVPRNTTIDGGCRGFLLTVDRGRTILTMREENNIIMRMQLEQRAPFAPGHGDCVNGIGADRIWVAFNTLRLCENILVDIGIRNYSPTKPIRSTVAFNLLRDHEKDMLFATYDCEADHVGCENQLGVPWTWQGGVQTTVQGNVFDGTSQRHPRLAGQSYAHVLDNVIAFTPVERKPGAFGPAYGSYAGDGSRMLVMNNLYVSPAQYALTAVRAEEGKGATRLVRNKIIGNATANETGSNLVLDPPYPISTGVDWGDVASAMTCAASRVTAAAAQANMSTPCR